MKGPLDGVRIVDLTTVLMGPFATQMLGDMGADVIKIEGAARRRNAPDMALSPSRHGPYVHERQPQQALGGARPQARRGAQGLVRAAGRGRRADLQHPAARHGAHRAFVRRGGAAQPPPALRGRVRLQPARALCRQARLRRLDPGRGGPAASVPAPGLAVAPLRADQSGRPHRGPADRQCRVRGPVLPRANRPGAAHRCADVRGHARAGHGRAPGGAGFEPPVDGLGYNRILTADRRPFATRDGHICVLIYNDKQWQGSAG